MSFDVSQLEDRIRVILTSPGVDLATISAKRVRKRLLEEDPELSADVLKEYKDDIDSLIGKVYEQVSGASTGGYEEEESAPNGSGSSRKRQNSSGDAGSTSKPKKQKKSEALTDEEVARQLDSQINARERTSRSAAGGKASKKGTKATKKGSKKKSAAVVDSDGEGTENGDGEKPKRRGGGLSKEYVLSGPLASLLNEERSSRPQVVKKIWAYIKEHNLQNPSDKREIICDASLNAVFKVDKINMFKMNKALGDHLHDEPMLGEV